MKAFRIMTDRILKRREGQLYAILEHRWAPWLFSGAIVDLSVEGGELVIRGCSKPDRPKRPNGTVAKRKRR
jgi:hypothetical protein